MFEAFKEQGIQNGQGSYRPWHDRDFVEIDFSVPDKILIEQFTGYLLDLKLWEKEEGCSISLRVMADAIFPYGEKGEEMVRKTTKKIADMLIENGYTNFLATTAAQEIMEKNSRKIFRKK